MPLPQQVIEQLQREPSRTPGWSSQLLMFSSAIFLVTLFIYFGLAFGYTPYLNSSFKNIEDQKQALSQKIPEEKRDQLVSFYSQLANLSSLLSRHVVSSPLFDWLQANTEKNIYFTKFSLNVGANQLALNATARSLDDINQELIIFQSQPEVKKISVNSISFINGSWQLDVTLFFDSAYLKYKTVK